VDQLIGGGSADITAETADKMRARITDIEKDFECKITQFEIEVTLPYEKPSSIEAAVQYVLHGAPLPSYARKLVTA